MPDIKKLVRRIIKKCGTNNPFEICACLGIKVIFKNLNNVRGLYQFVYRKKIICINFNLNSADQRQVCAHELGHAILHKNVNTVFWDRCTYFVTDKVEIEANIFAAELLIDDDELREYGNSCRNNVAAIFGVQEKLVEYKIRLLQK